MEVSALPALLLFQDAASTPGDIHLIMIFTGVIATILVLVILVAAIAAAIVASKVSKLTQEANAKAQPLLARGTQIAGSVNDILTDLKPKIAHISADLQPKIANISGDVQHIASLVRSKVDEAGNTFTRVNQTVQGYNDTAQDVNAKAKGQVARVNDLVSDALTTTQHVSKQIQHGIRVPVERVASWVTAARITLENLSERLPFLNQNSSQRTPPSPRPGAGPRPVPTDGVGAGPRVVHTAADLSPEKGGRNTPPTGS